METVLCYHNEIAAATRRIGSGATILGGCNHSDSYGIAGIMKTDIASEYQHFGSTKEPRMIFIIKLTLVVLNYKKIHHCQVRSSDSLNLIKNSI